MPLVEFIYEPTWGPIIALYGLLFTHYCPLLRSMALYSLMHKSCSNSVEEASTLINKKLQSIVKDNKMTKK